MRLEEQKTTHRNNCKIMLGILMIAAVGCRPSGSGPASSNNTTDDLPAVVIGEIDVEETNVAAETSDVTSDDGPSLGPAATTATLQDAAADSATADNVAVEPDATATTFAATESMKVELGSAELTAGIPGEGALQVVEIQAWLDNPENHLPLDIELPVGLSAGKTLIQGIRHRDQSGYHRSNGSLFN